MFWNEMINLQRELDKIFNTDYLRTATFGRGVFPAVNIFEKNDTVIVKAEVPGLKKDDLKITLENDVLSLSGETKKSQIEKACFHRKERPYGTFSRSLKLPYKVDPEKTNAKLENGVLTMTLEKHEGVKPKTINIQ